MEISSIQTASKRTCMFNYLLQGGVAKIGYFMFLQQSRALKRALKLCTLSFCIPWDTAPKFNYMMAPSGIFQMCKEEIKHGRYYET